ncbi:hypothetical protein ALC62_11900 [Cyphomyrmex costatus]|uniref:Uncharacterized protein n=1 Tax=Cyphomyrmex costatus TaxID=456900 RepID=A0A195CBM9_9HYME|nr:hypothetical protein ALC62_11900 [Cyphomyrmex costatus]
MLTRNARTFDSSFFAWLQALFNNRNDVSIFPKFWPSQLQFQEWTRNGITSLLRLVFFNTEEPIHIEFRPEDGPRAAKTYQRRFGYRGEWLIKQLGNGFNSHVLLNRQQVPNTFLVPPLTSFRSSNLIRSASAFEYNR